MLAGGASVGTSLQAIASRVVLVVCIAPLTMSERVNRSNRVGKVPQNTSALQRKTISGRQE